MLWVASVKLTLPLPPNRANAREHWRVTDRKKKEYYGKADVALLSSSPVGITHITLVRSDAHGRLRPRLTHAEKQRMRLDATLYLWATMDRDNLVARLKWVLDSLVNYGLLVDDNEEWLDLQMPKQVVDRKNRRVEIELTPSEGEGGLGAVG